MTASAFSVILPTETPAKVLFNGMDAITVYAHNAADAIAIAKAQYNGDSDALWAAATATPVVAATDFTGWRLRVSATDNLTPFTNINLTVTGAAGNAVADIAALMVTALNATVIDHAAFSGSTLTVAGTADGMGDWKLSVYFYPPSANVNSDVSITDFITNVVSAGASGDALSVDLNTSFIAPSIPVGFRLHK